MSFINVIELFLAACPGPPLARLALRTAALQPVNDVFFGVPACGLSRGGEERGENDNKRG